MKTKQIALTAMFAALTMVLGPLVVVVPFTPIPFTLALIPIYLSGALLPKHYALYSQVVYLLAGMVGLPVFSQFRSGVAVLAGPTGGYLIAYPLMAFLIAFLLEKTHSHGYVPYFLTMLCALALCYLFGSLWFMVAGHVTWAKSVTFTVIPFVIPDLLKVVFSAAAALALNRALAHAKLLPKNG